MADASKMIPHIKKWEGGYANDADDKGGCTMMGVTIGTYRRYYGANKTCADLQRISNAEWLHIFKNGYWGKMKADQIRNQSIAELCVDMCWVSGEIAIKKIQQVLGVTADGIVGSRTLAALNGGDQRVLFEKLWQMRAQWLVQISYNGNNRKFLRGWLARLVDLSFSKY